MVKKKKCEICGCDISHRGNKSFLCKKHQKERDEKLNNKRVKRYFGKADRHGNIKNKQGKIVNTNARGSPERRAMWDAYQDLTLQEIQVLFAKHKKDMNYMDKSTPEYTEAKHQQKMIGDRLYNAVKDNLRLEEEMLEEDFGSLGVYELDDLATTLRLELQELQYTHNTINIGDEDLLSQIYTIKSERIRLNAYMRKKQLFKECKDRDKENEYFLYH